jgi:mRNA interferase MazF
MPIGKPGEIWQTDLGMQAKVRPCLVLTQPPRNDELAVITLVAHTTSVRGNRWEIVIPKHFLQAGAFDVQRIVTVDISKLERKLGELSPQEFDDVLDKLAERLGI